MRKRRRSILKKLLLAVFFLILCLALFIFLSFFFFSSTLPSFAEIRDRQVIQSTKIYDRTGKILLYEISNGERRTVIPFEEIPQALKNATIAIEDENFYSEPGVSFRGILRALLVNLRHGEILQGGSTITQQLARNTFLSTEQTISRKIKEFLLAIRLNRHYSKDEILSLYLNEIPYGPTLYGVEAASQAYFDKSAKDLNVTESAILAALPKAPSYYSPWGSHQKELLDRSRLVLKKMRELDKISEKDLNRALKEKVAFAAQQIQGIKAPHFIIAVQDYLVEKYGEELVRSGGLRVTTTLDWPLQELAEKMVLEGAKRNEELYGGKNAALVTEDPKNGQILAMVGSRDYFDTEREGNFNVATQGLRQPGSALKPFVYLAAFEKGYTPETVLFDVSTDFNASGRPEKSYAPENFDGKFRGPISLRQALAQSINIPAVKTLYLVGLEEAIKIANHFGISTLTDPSRYGLSLVLGGGEVRLIDMVNAYSILAQDGTHHSQTIILEVKDSQGKILESGKDVSHSIIDSQYPRLINDILSDIDARAGLYQNSLSLTTVPGYDIALKTGTSNDYRDAWVFGYTPGLVTGVWAGNNNNQPMEKRGSSILAALPIWNAFMKEALKNREVETFSRPESDVVQKPILLGDYLAGQHIHSILYYVDRRDPRGLYPENPDRDPQFKNWEVGVLDWARQNLPNFSSYNQPGTEPPTTLSAPPLGNSGVVKIEIQKPGVGEFISNQVNIQAILESRATISEIAIYLNGELISRTTGGSGEKQTFVWQFTPQNLLPQNLLELEVINKDNQKARKGVIVYH